MATKSVPTSSDTETRVTSKHAPDLRLVTGGNVTGITDHLVAEGLVVREDSQKDRRTYIVKLTPEGCRSFRNMTESHEKCVSVLFADMAEQQREQIYELLSILKSSATRTSAQYKRR